LSRKSYITSSFLFIEGIKSALYTSDTLLFSARASITLNAFLLFLNCLISQTLKSCNINDDIKLMSIIFNIIYFTRVSIS